MLLLRTLITEGGLLQRSSNVGVLTNTGICAIFTLRNHGWIDGKPLTGGNKRTFPRATTSNDQEVEQKPHDIYMGTNEQTCETAPGH